LYLWRRSRHDWLFVYILVNDMTSFIQPLTYSTRSHYKRHNIYNFKTSCHWLIYIQITNRVVIVFTNGFGWNRKCIKGVQWKLCNLKIKLNTDQSKLNIMHVTVNFWGFFFSVWQDFHVRQSEWLTTSQQVSGSLYFLINTQSW
jgi:hypothetical protein